MQKEFIKKAQKTFVLQKDQSDCGVACLLSLIRFYDGENSLEELRKQSGTSIQGTTMLGLYQAANQNNLIVEGNQADISAIIAYGKPLILHCLIDEKLEHYIVCFGYAEDKGFLIGDPLAFDLIFFPTAEGFYDYENKRYIYQYKDHLGNVRMSYTKNTSSPNNVATVLDRNTYYAFGMNQLSEMSASLYTPLSSAFNYKYSGKELQETGMYDFGWRHYMPDIGRWNGMDQLAEKYMPISPYAYVANNPISLIDPDGRRIIRNIDGTYTFTGNDKIIHDYYMDNGGSARELKTQLDAYHSAGGSFGSGPISDFWVVFKSNIISKIAFGNGIIRISKDFYKDVSVSEVLLLTVLYLKQPLYLK